MARHSRLDLSTMHAQRLWFGYRPHYTSTIDGAAVPNMFTALSSLFEKYRGNFQFTYQSSEKSVSYRFLDRNKADKVDRDVIEAEITASDDPTNQKYIDEQFFNLTGLSTANYKVTDINYARINSQKTQFQKELTHVIATLKNADSFKKNISLASVKVNILDTGLYISFTDGNTATYVSDIFRYITAGDSAKDFIEKWATRSFGEPEVTINSNDTLSIEFAHIPGTEVYNFIE